MIRFFSRLGAALMVLVGSFSFGQSNIPATPSEAVMLLGGNAFQNLTETHTGMIHYPDVGTSQIIFVYANVSYSGKKCRSRYSAAENGFT